MTIRTYVKGSDTKISEHFSSKEFDCHCRCNLCKTTYVDTNLINYLEEKRRKWRKPVHITSGFRCTAHNQWVGGAAGSRHLVGQAADIWVSEISLKKVAKDCNDAGGLGVYNSWIHIDCRYGKSRWHG